LLRGIFLGGLSMAEAREVTITITERLFTLELALEDLDLIEGIFGALRKYVKKGSPINLKEACVDLDSLSKKAVIISKTISKGREMDEWIGETKELMVACLLRNEEGGP
jgi:hypothetical protein